VQRNNDITDKIMQDIINQLQQAANMMLARCAG